MKRTLAVAIAAAFLSTSGLVTAQRIDTETSTGWIGDEPDTRSAGRNPNAWDGSPSAAYPADSNGLGPARGPTGSPAPILAVNWVHNVPQSPSADLTSTYNRLLGGIAPTGMVIPGMGQFQAYFGTFQDHNGDGWITDGNHFYDRAHVNTRGDCQTQVSTTDGRGLGETLPTGETTDTHVTARCIAPDEFTPGASGTSIVAYVTPGSWGGSDFVNRWFGAWNPAARPKIASPENPDFAFQGIGVEQESTGRYFSPTTNFQYVLVDNSLLESLTLEAISNPVTVTDGPRTQEAGDANRGDGKPASLVEVDNYHALDPTVESLYLMVTTPLGAQGCQIELIERGCPRLTDAITAEARGEASALDPVVGPLAARTQERWEQNPNGLDYTDPHLFLDIVAHTSFAAGAQVSFNDNNIVGGYTTQYNNAMMSPTADGRTHAWPQLAFQGYFGVFEDKNADGWIGEPTASEGCADAYDCGNSPSPHEFPQLWGANTRGTREFTVACGNKEIGGGQVSGSFPLTVSPEGNSWGPTGVYVVTDRRNAANSNADTFVNDGRQVFNAYDDLVLDIVGGPGDAPGDVDALRMTGSITLAMVCTGQSGFYYSYERLLFPSGSNLAYDITYSGSTTGDFRSSGVPLGERVADTDVLTSVL